MTEFFRDPDLFDSIRDSILPGLIEEARKHGNYLRLWSAGCATGEEAHSLAILVAEVLGDEIDSFNVRIFATDIDGSAIAYARRGVYPAGAMSEVPDDVVERYFESVDGEYEIRKQIGNGDLRSARSRSALPVSAN